MGLHPSRVRRPEWLIAIGGVVLLAAMLLMPWYQLTLASGGAGPKYFVPKQVDGWNGLTIGHWVLLVTVLTALATAFFQAQRRAPALPVTLSLFALLLGGVSAAWLIIRVLVDPPGGRGIGGWIGLLAAAAIAYGGLKSIRTEGIAPEDGPASIPRVELARQSTG